ncbi:hypothetical protein BaRGS_00014339 [Batillaria attramentaria]|uniref:Uncharacterized protein n=1 Tax=Batillaria attramentaria TaxID=370345 RepID=A0ABD0L4X2_9CAEN
MSYSDGSCTKAPDSQSTSERVDSLGVQVSEEAAQDGELLRKRAALLGGVTGWVAVRDLTPEVVVSVADRTEEAGAGPLQRDRTEVGDKSTTRQPAETCWYVAATDNVWGSS